MTDNANPTHRIMVTGASGAMGCVLGPALVEQGHFVRGVSRRPAEGFSEMHTVDLADRQGILDAADGIDTIVHFGAYANDADFMDVLLGPNVIGLYNILDAAVKQGVKRVILSSSIQVVSGLRRQLGRPVAVEDGVAPTNHYALTKVWGEAAGEMYARMHELSILSVRICWFVRNPKECRTLEKHNGWNLYFSRADMIRFYTCALHAENPKPGEHAAVFAASKPKDRDAVDLEAPRQLIGYEPQETWPEGLPFEY